MREIFSNKSENPIKNYQIKFLILGFIFSIISIFIPYSQISYILLAMGVSIVLSSILAGLICPRYDGSYYFVVGSFVGFIVSLLPAIILRDLTYGNRALVFILSIGWMSGGYLSARDKVMEGDDFLNSPLMIGMTVLGILVISIFGLFIFTIILAFLPFISFRNVVLLSMLIVQLSLVRYLSKIVFYEDLEKIDYKPHVRGTFGSFLGGIVGMMCSFMIGHIYVQSTGLPMEIFWWGSYAGFVTGAVVGFFIGYNIEEYRFNFQKD
ncbi:MAG: hypothetical protein ACOC53_05150 [Candidatus Saliniplasma sp.]